MILFLESGHTKRERERESGEWGAGGGGGGGGRLNRTYRGVNFAFSSMPNDMHAEEKRQARLEPELKCKSEESNKVHRSMPTSCLDPLESKPGFSNISVFSQFVERAARKAPIASKKEQLSSLLFVA